MPLNYLDFKRVVKKLLRGQAFCSFVGPACCLIECQDLTFSISYFIIQDIQQRLHQQSRAFHGLFRQPDRVEELVEIVQRLEHSLGDLKLWVRTLASERAFQRAAAVQKQLEIGLSLWCQAVLAGSLINLATVVYLNLIKVPAVTAYLLCALFAMQVLIGILKVNNLDQQERLITGIAWSSSH
ncbi:putative ABC-type Cd(2+) transporter [Dioscorea sansibarensis]